jgi:hypothetical protein
MILERNGFNGSMRATHIRTNISIILFFLLHLHGGFTFVHQSSHFQD